MELKFNDKQDPSGMFSKAGRSTMERYSILQASEQILNQDSKHKHYVSRFSALPI